MTLLKADTGERRVVTSNESGDREARLLTPGTYQVTFERVGFKTLVRDGVGVSTSEVATVNVELEVGDVGQSIEVFAGAQMVSSSSATVVRTLDRRELEALPTSSRNFTQLLMIEAGVEADISELLDNSNASISPSVNGARTTNNSLVFNGVDTTSLLCCNTDRVDRYLNLNAFVPSGAQFGNLGRNTLTTPGPAAHRPGGVENHQA